MNLRQLRWSVASAVLAGGAAWVPTGVAAPVIFNDIALFRTALGDPNNGNNPGARREINWDGGGATNGTAAVTPFTVFQNTRGATFTTPGTGLTQTPITGGTVDIIPGGALQANLADINPAYATSFATLSALRLFVPIGSNITDATFSVPGTGGAVPASVGGFGVVFTDVDIPGSSTLEFFAVSGGSLGSFAVDVGGAADASLSFLGVLFDAGERVGRVRITVGNTALGPSDSIGFDVVAMDDFLYSEPRLAPEPAMVALFGLGLAGLALTRRRKPS